MLFMENIQKFIDKPGNHASHKYYKEMKATLEYMMKNAVDIKKSYQQIT